MGSIGGVSLEKRGATCKKGRLQERLRGNTAEKGDSAKKKNNGKETVSRKKKGGGDPRTTAKRTRGKGVTLACKEGRTKKKRRRRKEKGRDLGREKSGIRP